MSIGQSMQIAFNNGSKESSASMALWPANVPFVTNVISEIWVSSATSTTSISAISERWATGEN